MAAVGYARVGRTDVVIGVELAQFVESVRLADPFGDRPAVEWDDSRQFIDRQADDAKVAGEEKEWFSAPCVVANDLAQEQHVIATFVVLPRSALDPADSAEQAWHLDVLRPRHFQALSGRPAKRQRSWS